MMERKFTLKLSIIVPVYNVEKYLERCVNSLLHQDLDPLEYEIILINDGSTDRSYEIAKKYSEQFTNIIFLSQENRGQGAARNWGLEKARGEYVMFVDSDDQLLANTLDNVLAIAIKNQVQVCAYGLFYYDGQGNMYRGAVQPFCASKVYTGEYAILHGADIGSSCTYLYLLEFLNKHKLRFLEGIYHEDVDFIMRVYALSERIIFTDKIIYSYTYNENSTDRKMDDDKRKKQYCDEFSIVKHIREFSIQYQIEPKVRNYLQRHGNSLAVSNLLRLRSEKDFPRSIKCSILDFMEQAGIYPIKGRTLSWKTSMLIPFFNIRCLLRKYVLN